MKRHLPPLAVPGSLIAVAGAAQRDIRIRLCDRIATNLCISLVLVLGLQVFMGNSASLSLRPYRLHGDDPAPTIHRRPRPFPRPDEGDGAAGPLSIPRGRGASPYLAIAAGRHRARRWCAARRLLSADAAFPMLRRGHHLLRALLVVLYTVMTQLERH